MACKVPMVSCMQLVWFHTYIGCDVFKRVGVMTYGVEEMSGLTCFKSDIELRSSYTQYG